MNLVNTPRPRYNVYAIRYCRKHRLMTKMFGSGMKRRVVKCQHPRLSNFHTRKAAVKRAIQVSGQSPAKTGFERVYVEFNGVKIWDSGFYCPKGWESIS